MVTDPAGNPRAVSPVRGGVSSEPLGGLPVSFGPRGRSRFAVGCCILLVIVGCMVAVGRGFGSRRHRPQYTGQVKPLGTVPGEFERQDAILLAWPLEVRGPFPAEANEFGVREDQLFCEIARAVWRSTHVVVLVPHPRTEDRVRQLLSQASVPPGAVSFVRVPFDTEWIRDYGPMQVRGSDGSCTLIDAEYVERSCTAFSPHDDRLPSLLGASLEMPVVRAPIALEHGNLLSNGRGLYITTRRLIDYNVGRGYDAEDVTRILTHFYGAAEVVFLERLQNEPTGHVDMFATFLSPDVVVVAQCSPESDPVNAAILDRNAQRLASLSAPWGPMKVARMPMPRLPESPWLWFTYTNVVYANGTLLVPLYPGLGSAAESPALALYQELLPGWKIVGIDADSLVQLEGSLHCITLNLPSADKIRRALDEQRPQSQASTD